MSKKNIISGIIIVVIIWLLSGILIEYNVSERGTFGDMFGAVNALFSGLALFGIIVSILIQQKELNLQRIELKETRKEFITNRFTNILFKQLDLLNTIIDRHKFIGNENVAFEKSENIDDFVFTLQKLRETNLPQYSTDLINKNSSTIASLSNKVNRILTNFNEFLNENNFTKEEIIQMKKLFKSNINPSIIPLLLDRNVILENSLKEIHYVKDDTKEIYQNLILIEIEHIKYILEFDKN